MARNFTLAINGAFESSTAVRAIPAEYVRREGEGGQGRTIVTGLCEAIARCAAEWKVFSDLGVPWATATEPFALKGYRTFPRKFRR